MLIESSTSSLANILSPPPSLGKILLFSPAGGGKKKKGDRGRLTGGGREGKISGNQQDA